MNCAKCKKKTCLKDKKPCEKVEKMLENVEVGRKSWLTYTNNLPQREEIEAYKNEQKGRKLPKYY